MLKPHVNCQQCLCAYFLCCACLPVNNAHNLHEIANTASCILMLLVQTYMLKLAKSGEDGEKAFLVLESGSRFHTTQVLLHAHVVLSLHLCAIAKSATS